MITRIRIAAIVATALAAAPQVHAQSKTTSTTPIPFYAKASGDPAPDRIFVVSAAFDREIPAGKRLVVQHISLNVLGNNMAEDPIQAKCQLFGRVLDLNGDIRILDHFIPLSVRLNTEQHTASFTAGQQATIYLEAGPIVMECSSGVGIQGMSALQAFITGELIPK